MTDETDKSTRSPAIPGILGEMGKKQFEAAVAMQKEFLDTVQEINHAWLVRAQSRATLASDLVGKLAAVRSMPDAATACQECMSRQMEIFAEDGRRMIADGEKLMRAGARLLSNGSRGGSS